MKLLAVLTMLVPFVVAGQSKADYKRVMTNFQTFYNAGKGDSISALFGNKWAETWSDASTAEYLKDYGTVRSLQFIGIDQADPNKVYVFKSDFSNVGTRAISLKMDKKKNVTIFRFVTSSEGINKLLAQRKSSQ